MEILPAVPDQAAIVAEIYDKARAFMRRSGNLKQWSDSYPSSETFLNDISRGGSYVCMENGRIVGTFFFVIGEEPTYRTIYNGSWLNSERYGVIHRVATDGSVKGVMPLVLDFCFQQVSNIRIDTHQDNILMRKILADYGFRHCGVIYLANGDERLAYQMQK